MRLDELEIHALNKALENIEGEAYLFGSRLFDEKKGGDIDILIFSEENAFHLSQDISIKFFTECEEKIDVVVIDPNKINEEQQAFLNTISIIRLK